MIVFPAIDIQNGHAVRLRQGVKDDSTTYFENPVDAAVKWCDEGAMFLHVVDLDGAFSGTLTNASIIGDICEAVDIPVEVGGGIRSEEAIETYLEAGVNRVIIGSKAVEDPKFITPWPRNTARPWPCPSMPRATSSQPAAGSTAATRRSCPLPSPCSTSASIPWSIRTSAATAC